MRQSPHSAFIYGPDDADPNALVATVIGCAVVARAFVVAVVSGLYLLAGRVLAALEGAGW